MTNKTFIYKSTFYFTFALISLSSLISFNFNTKTEINDVSIRLDYFYHFIAYFLLALFFLLWKHKKNSGHKFFIVLFSFGIFFSTVFEVIQIFIPNRVFNPIDLLFNLIGFVTGISSYYLVRGQKSKVMI